MNKALVKILKDGRKAAKLTQLQVAEALGVRQNVLSQWETGKFEPDIDTFLALLRLYKIPYADVFPEIQKEERLRRFYVDEEEQLFLSKFRALTTEQRVLISALVDQLVDMEDLRSAPIDPRLTLPFGYTRVSAGSGNEIGDELGEIRIKDSPEARKADFVLQVDGASMEPKYKDGDFILIRRQPDVELGEIGVWLVDGRTYVKQKTAAGLHSLNPDYPDVEMTAESDIHCFGKVIGKAEI